MSLIYHENTVVYYPLADNQNLISKPLTGIVHINP